MNKILIDTSIWIEYFKSKSKYKIIDELIRENQICTNDIILSEILPSLYVRNEYELIDSIKHIDKVKININWEMIVQMQIRNYKNGINKVGIPDLIILQNVIGNNLIIFTLDKHFELMKKVFEYRLFKYKD